MSLRGFSELTAAGLGAAVHGVWLDGYRIHRGSHISTLGHPSAVLAVRRFDLDAALLERAERSPALSVLTGEGLASVECEEGGFTLCTSERVISCKFLIAADGIDSRTLSMLGVPRVNPRHIRYGLSSTWQITNGDAGRFVETFLLSGGEGFFTPVGDGFMNVSFLGSKKLITQLARRDYREKLVAQCSAVLGITLKPHDHPLGAAAVNAGFRAAYLPTGVLAVGDACESFDPVGGMGMTHAVISGRAAADQIALALRGGESLTALRSYASQRETAVRGLRGFTHLTGLSLGTWGGRRLLPLLVRSGLAAQASQVVHHGKEGSWVARLLNVAGVLSAFRLSQLRFGAR
jgi:flavin-dependent dehydrogenase